VWAVGDGADGGPASRAVEDLVTRSGRVDRFPYLGDVYPTGTRAQFTRDYRSVYGRRTSRTWRRCGGPCAATPSRMQRFHPVDGLTEFVDGAGGHRLHAVNSSDPRLAFSRDHSFGALRLRLRPGLAEYAFVDAAGRTLDSGHLACSAMARPRA
jgi:hypothetical protein